MGNRCSRPNPAADSTNDQTKKNKPTELQPIPDQGKALNFMFNTHALGSFNRHGMMAYSCMVSECMRSLSMIWTEINNIGESCVLCNKSPRSLQLLLHKI